MTFGKRLWYHVKRFPTAVSGTFQTLASIFATRGASGSAVLLALLCLVLAIGVAATYCVIWLSRSWRQNFQTLRSEDFAQQISVLLIRFGLELSGLLAFTIAAVASAYLFVTQTPDRILIVSFLLTAVFITWFTAAFLRFILAPNRPDLRLVAANDATSKSIFVGYVGLGAVIGAGFFLFGVMTRSEVQFVDSFRFWVAFFVICWDYWRDVVDSRRSDLNHQGGRRKSNIWTRDHGGVVAGGLHVHP